MKYEYFGGKISKSVQLLFTRFLFVHILKKQRQIYTFFDTIREKVQKNTKFVNF